MAKTVPTGQQLKERGQAASVERLVDKHWADFEAALAAVPDGAEFTVNDVRDALDLAGVPRRARGGLFAHAVSDGLATPLTMQRGGKIWKAFVPSTGASAHYAQVQVYVRGNLLRVHA